MSVDADTCRRCDAALDPRPFHLEVELPGAELLATDLCAIDAVLIAALVATDGLQEGDVR